MYFLENKYYDLLIIQCYVEGLIIVKDFSEY
jgi:hypothetical protein